MCTLTGSRHEKRPGPVSIATSLHVASILLMRYEANHTYTYFLFCRKELVLPRNKTAELAPSFPSPPHSHLQS